VNSIGGANVIHELHIPIVLIDYILSLGSCIMLLCLYIKQCMNKRELLLDVLIEFGFISIILPSRFSLIHMIQWRYTNVYSACLDKWFAVQ